jgi:hypothetical protein
MDFHLNRLAFCYWNRQLIELLVCQLNHRFNIRNTLDDRDRVRQRLILPQATQFQRCDEVIIHFHGEIKKTTGLSTNTERNGESQLFRKLNAWKEFQTPTQVFANSNRRNGLESP